MLCHHHGWKRGLGKKCPVVVLEGDSDTTDKGAKFSAFLWCKHLHKSSLQNPGGQGHCLMLQNKRRKREEDSKSRRFIGLWLLDTLGLA